MIAARHLALCACLVLAGSAAARAQTGGRPASGNYEAAVGASWVGATSFGSADASLTGATGGAFRLFSTATELDAAPALDVRFGRRVTRVVQAEVSASYSTPMLKSSISADAESGANTVASESLRQFTIVGGAVVFLPRWQARRLLPFLTGGAGYIRQLHEGDTLVQSGGTYYVGGGVTIPIADRGPTRRLSQLGVRLDGRALIRTGATTLDSRSHTSPALTASLFARF